MHTVEMLEQALSAARALGYGIRQEFLGGSGGGACEIAGKKWLFIDLTLSVGEQLEQVLDALSEADSAPTLKLSNELATRLESRRAA